LLDGKDSDSGHRQTHHQNRTERVMEMTHSNWPFNRTMMSPEE